MERILKDVLIVFILILTFSCSGSDEDNSVNQISYSLAGADDTPINADKISIGGQTTRSLWSFESDNLSVKRAYENGDVFYVINPYLPKAIWDLFPYPKYDYQRLYYTNADNRFYPPSGGGVFFQKTFTPPAKLSNPMVKTDTLTIAIFDKNYTDWKYDISQDTSFVLNLTKQTGKQNDAFARQLIYLPLPYSQYNGTHLWTKIIMAYYWLVFTFPDHDVASIDTIRIHSDEPMPSTVAWHYKGHLSKKYTRFEGPYTVGINSFSSSGADAFIAFYVGNGTASFNNFGFDISYTLTDGTKHKGSSNVRPQVKNAAAGNLYKNGFMISKAHGLQNVYVDEKVEVDNWSKAYDQSVIAPKSGAEIEGDINVDPAE